MKVSLDFLIFIIFTSFASFFGAIISYLFIDYYRQIYNKFYPIQIKFMKKGNFFFYPILFIIASYGIFNDLKNIYTLAIIFIILLSWYNLGLIGYLTAKKIYNKKNDKKTINNQKLSSKDDDLKQIIRKIKGPLIICGGQWIILLPLLIKFGIFKPWGIPTNPVTPIFFDIIITICIVIAIPILFIGLKMTIKLFPFSNNKAY